MDYTELTNELFLNTASLMRAPQLRLANRMLSGEMLAMTYLKSHNSAPPCEIGASMEISSARMAKLIASLLKKNYVHCERDAGDRRKIIVALTREGEAYLDSQINYIVSQTRLILEYLGEEDAKEFVRLAGKIASSGIARQQED